MLNDDKNDYDKIKAPWIQNTKIQESSSSLCIHETKIPLDDERTGNDIQVSYSNLTIPKDPQEVTLVNMDSDDEAEDITHMIMVNRIDATSTIEPMPGRPTRARKAPKFADDDVADPAPATKKVKFTTPKKLIRKSVQIENSEDEIVRAQAKRLNTKPIADNELDPVIAEVKEAARRAKKTSEETTKRKIQDIKERERVDIHNKAIEDLRKQIDHEKEVSERKIREAELKVLARAEKKRIVTTNKELIKQKELMMKAESKIVREALMRTRKEQKAAWDRTRRLKKGNGIVPESTRIIPSSTTFTEPNDETTEQQRERELGEKQAELIAKDLIGMIYEDPISGRLYECAYIGWDANAKELVSWRQSADGMPTEIEDSLAYAVRGKGGIEELITTFKDTAGYTCGAIWPRTEEEFRNLQIEDPELRDIITRLEKGEVIHVPRGKRKFYLPILKTKPSEVLDEDIRKHDKKVRQEYEQDIVGQEVRDVADQIMNHVIIPKSALRVEGYEVDGALSEPLTVIPRKLVQNVLKFYHEGTGHTGRDRVVQSIKMKYWWSGMWEDVNKHVGACRHCKLRKGDTHAARLPLQRYPIGTKPFDICHIDLTGRFVRSASGYEYILVVKCALTQWVELIPIRNKSAEEVQRALIDRVFMVHGSICTLISDNGQEFKGKLSEIVNHLVDNDVKTITPYNPQSNSRVEQANSTIKNMLSMYISENQRDWDLWLPVIAHAYRTTVSTSTGFSPFRLVFGREAKQPAEAWIEDFAASNEVNIYEYVNKLTEALLYSWKKAGSSIHNTQELKDHRKPDPRERVFKPYAVGDKFFMKSIPKRYLNKGKKKQKLSLKLQERWTGPHTILEVYNPVLYRATVNNRIRNVHAIRMKRDVSVKERFVPLVDTYELDDEESEESDQYSDNDESDSPEEAIEEITEDN